MGHKNPVTGPAHDALVTHGGYRLQHSDVEDWPVELQKRYEERFAEVMAIDHVEECHKGSVAQLVRAEIIVGRIFAWLLDNWRIKAGALPPVATTLVAFENSLARRYAELGLQPYLSRRIRLLVGDERPSWALELSGEVEADDD
jgi:hypothetical protein